MNRTVHSENKGINDITNWQREYIWNRSHDIKDIKHSISKRAPKNDCLKIKVEDIDSVPVTISPLPASRKYRETSE